MMRRLDVEMVRRRLVGSRSAAARAIREGKVIVTGIPLPKPATLVSKGTPLRWAASPPRYVSRGGLKLEAALEEFAIDVAGLDAIDVGASTGGFTHCLLDHGVARVVAVDVGYGQLHEYVRNDPRVTVVERTNIRHADPEQLGAPFGVIVADVSFISLLTVAPVLVGLGNTGSQYILLVKPQFEAGPGSVDRRGVLRDRTLWNRTVADTVTGLSGHGLGAIGLVRSPVAGANGNREVLGWFRHGPLVIDLERTLEDLR
ncbi:MAG: TlyA family RNA methyltransferase [bacterium]|nr:TlyA family RNA methyltransferase [bacterium]